MLKIVFGMCMFLNLSSLAWAQKIPTVLPTKKVRSQTDSIPSSLPHVFSENTLTEKEVEVAAPELAPPPDPVVAPAAPPEPTFNHQIQASLMPTKINGNWDFQGESFQYSHQTLDSFELLYRYRGWDIGQAEFQYSRLKARTQAESIATSSMGLLSLQDSSTTLETFIARFSRFWRKGENPDHNTNLSFEVAMDSQATPQFTSANELILAHAKDLKVGARFQYQRPLQKDLNLVTDLTHLIGTGSSLTNNLKSKSSSKTNLTFATHWKFDKAMSLETGIEYEIRKAQIASDRMGIEENWKVNSADLILKLGINRSF